MEKIGKKNRKKGETRGKLNENMGKKKCRVKKKKKKKKKNKSKEFEFVTFAYKPITLPT